MAENNETSAKMNDEQNCDSNDENTDSFFETYADNPENERPDNVSSGKAENQTSEDKIIADDTALAELEKTLTPAELDVC